jgi:hypothetical protein
MEQERPFGTMRKQEKQVGRDPKVHLRALWFSKLSTQVQTNSILLCTKISTFDCPRPAHSEDEYSDMTIQFHSSFFPGRQWTIPFLCNMTKRNIVTASATGMAKTSLDFESLERSDTVNPNSQGAPNTGESRSGPQQWINSRHVLQRSCYRRETFNRLREIAETSPANRPPQLGSITSREEQKETLHAPGSKTHRENTHSSSRKELKNYYDSIVEREASKWQSIHHSIKVKTARNTDAYWIRLDEVHK